MKRSIVLTACIAVLAALVVFATPFAVRADSNSQISMPPNSITTEKINLAPGEVLTLSGLGSKNTISMAIHGQRGLVAYVDGTKKESSMPSDSSDFQVAALVGDGMVVTATLPSYVIFDNSDPVTYTFTVDVKTALSTTGVVTATVKSFSTEKLALRKSLEVQRGPFAKGDLITFSPQAPKGTTLFSSKPFTTTSAFAAIPYGGKYFVSEITGALSESISAADGEVYLGIVPEKDVTISLTTPVKVSVTAPSAAKPGTSSVSSAPPATGKPGTLSAPPGAESVLPKTGDGDRELNFFQTILAWIGRQFSGR